MPAVSVLTAVPWYSSAAGAQGAAEYGGWVGGQRVRKQSRGRLLTEAVRQLPPCR